jgi:2-C-methyl-D-erythritol 4-phosphate cytidylyltransferase
VAVALLVAAGSGERLGADRPKALVVCAGRTLLEWSLLAVRAAGVDHVVVASPPDALTQVIDIVRKLPERTAAAGDVTVTVGGATRSESVRNALDAAPASEAVVVHDAARPLATPELFERCLAGLAHADGAIAAARVTDTIKESGPDRRVERTLDRSRLWAIQTPQAFRRAALERALDVPADVLAQATDDAWLVERDGGTVAIVEAPASNFKVTTPHDLLMADLILSERR